MLSINNDSNGMKAWLVGILAFFALAQSAMADDIELITDKGTLRGTLEIADSGTERMVIFVSGSGPTDRDGNNTQMKNNSLKMVAEALKDAGYSSFRYDKRGIAGSASGSFIEADLRFDHFVDDLVLWGNHLKAEYGVKSIYLLGHSEGALIVTLGAERLKAEKVILLAGIGERGSSTLIKQLKAGGLPPAMLEGAIKAIHTLEKGKLAENTPPALAGLFRASVQPYMISWFKYDPAKEAAALTMPVKAIFGETDIQVAPSNGLVFTQASDAIDVDVIAGMNHVLKTAPADRAKNIATYTQPALPLTDGLMESILTFFAK